MTSASSSSSSSSASSSSSSPSLSSPASSYSPSSTPRSRYHIISWIVPLIMATIPLIGDKYGPAGQWCWIVDNWKWRFFVLATIVLLQYFIVVLINNILHYKALFLNILYKYSVCYKFFF